VLARETVLVVDDEPFVLIEIADVLADAGAEVISVVCADQSLAAIELRAITAAVLDIGQPQETLIACAGDLRSLASRFYSGYGEAQDAWSHVPLIVKPAREKDIVTAVAQLHATREQARPPSLGGGKRQNRLT
jgi:DNA-binding NarL/FixJ family response regulator